MIQDLHDLAPGMVPVLEAMVLDGVEERADVADYVHASLFGVAHARRRLSTEREPTEGVRTPDPLFTKALLWPLSYVGSAFEYTVRDRVARAHQTRQLMLDHGAYDVQTRRGAALIRGGSVPTQGAA